MRKPIEELSDDANLVYDSLVAHPLLNTPEEIARSPMVVEQLMPVHAAKALHELAEAGWAAESLGRWTVIE
jgi:hypothetical protein